MHAFVQKRSCGTACIEVKLLQQLSKIQQKALYVIFIDLKKAYDTVDRERLLQILEMYGMGPRCLRLLRHYWDNQQCVARQGKYHGRAFQPSRGLTQGGVFSPTGFNVLADFVIRIWLLDVFPKWEVSRSGFGESIAHQNNLFNALFYADDGMAASTDPVWLQNAVQRLCDLFRCVGLKTNTRKTEVMTCHPGEIRDRLSMEGYKRRHQGVGDSYQARKRHRVTCPFPECGKDLAAGSLQQHLRSQHGTESSGSIADIPEETDPVLYTVDFPGILTQVTCPVEGCSHPLWSRSLLK